MSLRTLWTRLTSTATDHVCEAIVIVRTKRPTVMCCGTCGEDM